MKFPKIVKNIPYLLLYMSSMAFVAIMGFPFWALGIPLGMMISYEFSKDDES
jgi:hypothetical protein